MYSIYMDGSLVYGASRIDGEPITEGKIELEVNKAGSCSFILYPSHSLYNSVIPVISTVTIYRDSTLIFRGRVSGYADRWDGGRKVSCEGELAFLNDGIIAPYAFTGIASSLFTRFVQSYNTFARTDRQLHVGTVDITGTITRANTEYESPLSNIMSRLVDSLGGYISITGSEDARYINWTSEPINSGETQTVRFGENLLDFTKSIKAGDLITALIPLGASTDDGRVTIESVEGRIYLYDPVAVSNYGWIFGVEIWDDITVPATLVSKGQALLESRCNPFATIEVSALDLSRLDISTPGFMVGDSIRVISTPHNLDAEYILSKLTVDILNPSQDKITLGATFPTLTAATVKGDESRTTTNAVISTVSTQISTVSSQVSILGDSVTDISDSLTGSGGWVELLLGTDFLSSQTMQYRVTNGQVYVRGIAVVSVGLNAGTYTLCSGLPENAIPPYAYSFGEYTVTTEGTITVTLSEAEPQNTAHSININYIP